MLKGKKLNKMIAGLMLIATIIGFGTVGYMIVEKMDFIDALYMTVISITTTGFSEVKPLSHAGRLLTMIIIIVGISSLGYVATNLIETLIQNKFLRRYRMEKQIKALKNHCILCGFGRMGKKIAMELYEHNIPLIVIEQDQEQAEMLNETGLPYIIGDATDDETLFSAGIQRACYLIATLSDDASNVFTVLSARNLNPELHIVARANEDTSESKLRKAGANRVVAAIELGASRIASEMLHPGVIDFLDLIFRGKQFKLQIEEVIVGEKSDLIGKELKETPIREELDILIVLIVRSTGNLIYNPSAQIPIHVGDRLICIGDTDKLTRLKELSRHPAHSHRIF